MKIIVVLIAGMLTCNICQAQEEERPPRRPRMINTGNWVGRRILTKDFIEKVGITEEQGAKLKTELDALDEKTKELDKQINEKSLEQATIAKKVLVEPGASTDELMEVVEKIGALRTEQAKLMTQRLVVIRDLLTAEQRKLASEILTKESAQRRADMENRRRGAAGGGGGRPERPAAARAERERPPERPPVPAGW